MQLFTWDKMFRRLQTGTNSKTGDSCSHIIIVTFTSRPLNIFFTNRHTVYVNRQPTQLWSFKLPSEKYKICITLIWWPANIYRTVSQNGAIPYINPSIYSIESTSTSFLLVLLIAVFLFYKGKSKNDWAIWRNILFMDPVWYSFPFYMWTVRSHTGTKVTSD